MASTKFNMVQVGLQTDFGTAVAPTKQLPMKGLYEDKRQRHDAEYDAGYWTPTTITAEVGTETAMTLEGTAFFEVLPVLLNSGFEDVAPSGTYIHTYTVAPGAVATPKPLTALLGTVGTNIGGTGPAVKLKDLYLKTLTLSANINDKAVMAKAEFFGTTYDDNSGAGFAFLAAASAPLIATLEVINGLKGVIRYEDATATGGAFATMTDFECTILDWELVINTGIEPAYCLTDETTTWSALKYTAPSCEFKPIVRTNATTYAAVKGKANARTYQELQLFIAGTSGHDLTVNMTGLWDVIPTAHDKQDGEVVMKPTFRCKTPHTQTTTPHWLAVIVESTHNWT
jgi:hypothetical protein